MSAAEDGRLRIHSKTDMNVVLAEAQRRGQLMACSANEKEREVSMVGDGATITTLVLPSASRRHERILPGFRSLWTCAYSNDGTRLAAAGEPGNRAVVIGSDGVPNTVLQTNVGRISCIAFNCVDRLLATCGDDGYLGVWDANTGLAVTGLRTPFPLRRCAWSPRNPNLLAAAGTGGQYLLELALHGQHDDATLPH